MPVTCDLVLDCRAIVRMTLGFIDDRFLTSAEIRLGKAHLPRYKTRLTPFPLSFNSFIWRRQATASAWVGQGLDLPLP